MTIYRLLFAVSLLFLIGCASEVDSNSARESTPTTSTTAPDVSTTAATTPAATPPPKPTEPPQNAEGIWHYTCSNGCEGGAGSAVPCAKCGTTLVHNSAYHGNANATTPTINPATAAGAGAAAITAPAGKTPSVMLSDPTQGGPITTQGGGTVTTPTKAPEPPQNAAGVWHYTCPSGCAGGGGSAIACGGCGTTLVHNQAYHQ